MFDWNKKKITKISDEINLEYKAEEESVFESKELEKIKEPSKIFKEGYTTKEKGSGLGLMISKRNMEEMYGKLILAHTGEDYTEFLIKIAKV